MALVYTWDPKRAELERAFLTIVRVAWRGGIRPPELYDMLERALDTVAEERMRALRDRLHADYSAWRMQERARIVASDPDPE